MCGILCEISCNNCTVVKNEEIIERIKRRGPNSFQKVNISTETGIHISFCGSVLWMQGPQIIPQPVNNDRGILLYNGDIFDESWDTEKSDTEVIMEKLTNINNNQSELQIINVLKSLKGPFSIVYYNKISQDLFFSRDKIGRSSMLLYKNKDSIVISSVLGRCYECVEVPATYINILHLKNNTISLYPWNNSLSHEIHNLDDWVKKLQDQQSLPDEQYTFNDSSSLDLSDEENIVQYLERLLEETKCRIMFMQKIMEHPVIKETIDKVTTLLEKSVEIRLKKQLKKCKLCLPQDVSVCNHCSVGILFSGGLDCTILAFIANKYIANEQSIDLINVAFNKTDNKCYQVPDRLTGKKSLEELKKLCPTRFRTKGKQGKPKSESSLSLQPPAKSLTDNKIQYY